MARPRVIYGKVKRFFIDDKEVTEAEFDRRFPTKIKDVLASGILGCTSTTGWPRRSEAMAVDPRQVAKANEIEKRHGTGVVYEPKHGVAIIPDAAADKKLQKRLGYFDKDAFY